MPVEPELYSVPEFLIRYAIGRTSAYAEINAKRLPIIKRGRRTFVARIDAEAWLERLRQQTNGGAA